jgi:hypothetical protein
MKITLIVEGKTEKAFVPHLIIFLETRLSGRMPAIHTNVYNGRVPKRKNLDGLSEINSWVRTRQTW